MGRFEIIKRQNGEFQFNLKASNGEVILTSEGYKTKDSCKKGIESVRRNSADKSKFDTVQSKSGKTYFTLKAVNGRVIGSSEMYDNASARDNGMDSIRKVAPQAKIVDLTVRNSI